MRSLSCAGGTGSENLNFINGKATRTTCSFDVADIAQPFSIQTMTIDAGYTYTIDKSVFVKVKPGDMQALFYCSDISGTCTAESQCTSTKNYQYTAECSAGEVCCLGQQQPEPVQAEEWTRDQQEPVEAEDWTR